MKRILLVRHAECEMNLHIKGTIGGQSNSSPLTARGRQQAAALGAFLARTLPDLPAAASAGQRLIHASTAVRASDTAAILLQQYPPLPPLESAPAAAAAAAGPEQQQQQLVQHSDALLELSQGAWEGQPRTNCYTPQVLCAIGSDPWRFAAPGGESQQQLEQRVADYITQDVLPHLTPGGPPALIVSHGLAIKCFLRRVLGSDPGMTWKIRLDNTSITEVAWADGGPAAGWHVERVNDTSHLLVGGVEVEAPAAAEEGGGGGGGSKGGQLKN